MAGRILKGGGAPMDMNNFKKMVRQTMGKSKAGKIPNAIQKAYKPRVSIFLPSSKLNNEVITKD